MDDISNDDEQIMLYTTDQHPSHDGSDDESPPMELTYIDDNDGWKHA